MEMSNEPQIKNIKEILEEVMFEIDRRGKEKEHLIIAIDGRCASGKSTLAEELKNALSCNVFHMDDFFLRPEQRTDERYAEPGGNVDRERFYEEVLKPLLEFVPFSYRPFNCRTMSLGEPVLSEPSRLAVIEGTYSCHPKLWDSYDLHIFMTTSPDKQLSRIRRRNPQGADIFQKRWIPLEESYFAAYSVEERCALRFRT